MFKSRSWQGQPWDFSSLFKRLVTRIRSTDAESNSARQDNDSYRVFDRFRRWKIGLRLLVIFCSSIGLLLTIASAASYCKAWRRFFDYTTNQCGASALPERIICLFASLIWSMFHLSLLVPSRTPLMIKKLCYRLPRTRLTHPGFFVAFDLLLWMGLLGVGIFDAMVDSDMRHYTGRGYSYYYYSSGSSSSSAGSETVRTMAYVSLVGSVGCLASGLAHLILFSFACDDERRRRKGELPLDQASKAQQLADEIVAATEKHALFLEERRRYRRGSPNNAWRGRSRTNTRGSLENPGVNQPLLGQQRNGSEDSSPEKGNAGNSWRYGSAEKSSAGADRRHRSRTGTGTSERLISKFNRSSRNPSIGSSWDATNNSEGLRMGFRLDGPSSWETFEDVNLERGVTPREDV